MNDVFHNVLVSSPNSGGVFLLQNGRVRMIDGSDTTGFYATDKLLIRGFQPADVVIHDILKDESIKSLHDDIHDVIVHQGSIYVVGTSGNYVAKLNEHGAELQRWVFPGEKDSWHINCLAVVNGRVVFSAFGDFREAREYKGKTDGSGFVQDLESGERLITGLSQPHSIVFSSGRLFIANSEKFELHEYDSSFKLKRKCVLDGYTRGIELAGSTLYVGLSRSRNAETGNISSAAIVAMDGHDLEEIGRLDIPRDEVYSIRSVDATEVAGLVANVSSTSWRRMASVNSLMSQALEAEKIGFSRANEDISRLQMELQQMTIQVASSLDEVNLAREAVRVLEDVKESSDRKIEDLSVRLAEVLAKSEGLNRKLGELDSELTSKSEELVTFRRHHNVALEEIASARSEIAKLGEGLEESRRERNVAAEALENAEHEIRSLKESLAEIRQSGFWRMTAPFRWFLTGLYSIGRRLKKVALACAFFARNPGLLRPILTQAKKEGVLATMRRTKDFLLRGGPRDPVIPQRHEHKLVLKQENGTPVVVLTTAHCLYLARLIVDALRRAEIPAKIIQSMPEGGYDDVPHFVICPQMFPRLPGMYVAYQLEQSVSSRWFTEEYLRTLENSFAILDYSRRNIEFLNSKGLSLRQIYYLPVGPAAQPETQDSCRFEYDVLFYGDVNNERRKTYLERISKVFSVKVVSDKFGEELYRDMASAKVVVNIHYYPGALLETTRLWECLSRGKIVVSERSSDMDEHEELGELVDFVDIDDVDGMVSRIADIVTNEDELKRRVERIASRLVGTTNWFDFFFYRFLLATDNISFQQFWDLVGKNLHLPTSRLCLSLPEYTSRQEDFSKDNHYGFWMFPGLRHRQGWVGCALSYKYIAMLSKKQGFHEIAVCEDDVEFPDGFEKKWRVVDSQLQNSEWDIFSGLMADLHPGLSVSAIETRDGMTFVSTDRMISTVFNCYNQTVFNLIADWDEKNLDVGMNTIDRYLERAASLKVITTHPFLVGHKEEQSSTIWSFQNTQYSELIRDSEIKLGRKIHEFERDGGKALHW